MTSLTEWGDQAKTMTAAEPAPRAVRRVVTDAVPENAFPLSPAQSSIWLAYQLNPGTSQSIAQCIEVHGELDLELLNRAYVSAGHEFETLAVRLIEVGGLPSRSWITRSICRWS